MIQSFLIPPDHPIAKEFYDLECIQSTLIHHMNPTLPTYDAAKQDEYRRGLDLTNDRIRLLQQQIRNEQGLDKICTVGLTRGPNGFPIVDGRPSNGTPVLASGAPILTVVRN